MPSEPDRVDAVLDVVKASLEDFHSALVRAVEDVRGFLASHRAPVLDGAGEVGAQLGAFGAERIDPERFAGLLTVRPPLDAERLHRIEAALGHLEGLESRGTALFRTVVPPGGDLRDTVEHALATVGGAFAMIRVVASARNGRSEALDPAAFAGGLPVRRWGRAELRMAPPVVVEVDGADVRTGGLVELLDGNLKIVLLVSGDSPPAPLAGLVRPDVFVLQAEEPRALAAALAHPGPAVAALMPDGAARFVHDPHGGDTYARRLTVHELPDVESLPPGAGRAAVLWTRELRHLENLAAAGGGAPASPVASASPAKVPEGATDAPPEVDRLAGWLLQQARLSDV